METRISPTPKNYGPRQDDDDGSWWAVTVPHEHGPFASFREAEEFLYADQAEAK